MPRKRTTALPHSDGLTCFNEAAAVMPRKSRCHGLSQPRCSRFNEAAAVMPRKSNDARKLVSRLITLQ